MKKLLLILFLVIVCCGEAKAENAYTAIFETMTEEDYTALCRVVYIESAIADCPDHVNIAVVETVLNRVLADEFPNTIRGVCKQTGQFVYKEVPAMSTATAEAIQYVKENGMTVLPDYDYCYFATKKQSLGKDHVWIGGRHADGRPLKGKGMYFCRGKR